MKKYYFDTCIWRDFYENRYGVRGRPLGEYAGKLIRRIIHKKETLYFSDLIIRELKNEYGEEEITQMFNLLYASNILKKVEMTQEEYEKAKILASERNIPTSDALHAILAANNDAILISQDNHLQKMKDIAEVKKPEEI